MKIKVLHYVFGPCMKGYDITARQVVPQMGQRTIGLSEELLSYPDVVTVLEELAFGDSLEPGTPFEKIYFSLLPGKRWVIGRGIMGMDSAGRGAYFFHHLVMDEADVIKLNANPMTVFKKFRFFEKENDLPESRLIPATEIDISPGDCEFPLVDSLNKADMENLLADISAEKPGQPVWVILERGQERAFIEKLLGLLPFNRRKELSFSTDFYNSYNIQHHFRLVSVNSEEEIPYKNCIIYNFAHRVFPGKPAAKDTYLKTIAALSPKDIKPLVNALSDLQLNHDNLERLSHCREIIAANIKRKKQNLPVFYDVTSLETAFVLLGGSDPVVEPDYRLFCEFYGNFIDGIDPGWFIKLYSPVPVKIFFALFRLIESTKNTVFEGKVFLAIYGYLKTVENGGILNRLASQFPAISREMLDYFREDTRQIFYLAQLPDLEKDMRIGITRLIYLDMLKEKRREYFHQLSAVIKSLDGLGIDTQPLKIIVELQCIRETRDFPDKGLGQYRVGEEEYRQLLEIGMFLVKDNDVSLKKMCDYLYVPGYKGIFVEQWLEFIREHGIYIQPIKLLIYMESRDWIDLETRGVIFSFLREGILKLSYVRKYRNFLKKKEKDLPEYERLWEEIEKTAPRGFVDLLVERIKRFTGRKEEE